MSQPHISLAVKGPSGKFECPNLTPKTTFYELLSELSLKSSTHVLPPQIIELPRSRIVVKHGFPPKAIRADKKATLQDLGFASKEAVIIEEVLSHHKFS